MKIITVSLLFFCSCFMWAQSLFKSFNTSIENIDTLSFRDIEGANKLFEQQNEQLEQIKADYLDSLNLYEFKHFNAKFLFFSEDAHLFLDSLDHYSEEMLGLAKSMNTTSFLVEALVCKSSIYQEKSDSEMSIRLVKFANKLALESRDITAIFRSYTRVIGALATFEKLNEADTMVEMCLPYLSQFTPAQKSIFYKKAGDVKVQLNDFINALDYFNNAIQFTHLKNAKQTFSIYESIAFLYGKMREPKKSIAFCRKALEQENYLSNTRLGGVYYLMAFSFDCHDCANGIFNTDSANHYATLSAEKFLFAKDTLRYFDAMDIKVRIYIGEGQFNKAVQILQQGVELKVRLGYSFLASGKYGLLAYCYMQMKDYNKALFYANTGIGYASEKKPYDFLLSLLYTNSMIYENMGNYKQALLEERIARDYHDSIYAQGKITEVAKLETQFQLKIHEQETQLLLLEMEKQEIILKNKKIAERKETRTKQLLITTMISLASILLLTILVLFVRNRSKKKEITIKNFMIDKQLLQEKAFTYELKYLKEKLIKESQLIALNNVKDETIPHYKNDNYLHQKVKQDNNWRDFMVDFNSTYDGLLDKLKKDYPELSNNDLRMVSLVKLKLSIKDISTLLLISDGGVTKSKTRLRDKLGLNNSSEIPQFIDCFMDRHC